MPIRRTFSIKTFAIVRTSAPFAVTGLSLAATIWLTGCASGEPEEIAYARELPPQLVQREVLNIHVLHRPTTFGGASIELTNTSDRAFGPSTLWLNARYSRPIEGFAVGQTLVIPITEFVDQHSDRARAGGFFATEAPERIVLAQIEVPAAGDGAAAVGGGTLIGLIVAGKQED
jgi:hypothetical protein